MRRRPTREKERTGPVRRQWMTFSRISSRQQNEYKVIYSWASVTNAFHLLYGTSLMRAFRGLITAHINSIEKVPVYSWMLRITYELIQSLVDVLLYPLCEGGVSNVNSSYERVMRIHSTEFVEFEFE